MCPKISLHKIVSGLLALCLAGSTFVQADEKVGSFPVIPGWTLTVNPIVYTPDNLWDVIDGAADAFLSYEFEELHIGEYMNADSIDVRVELYKHSTPVNAFGIYSQERKPEYNYLDLGTEGYMEEGVLNMLCGRYYVKLSSHRTGPEGSAALQTTARSLDSHLGQEKGFPRLLALFPREGKAKKSESYIADSYLGYSFLRKAFVAQYGRSGKIQLFLMQFDSPEAAREALELYMKAITHPSRTVQEGKRTLDDPNNGKVGILLKGRYLSGVTNCADARAREGYLRTWDSRIKD
jgi:hypothetical protein